MSDGVRVETFRRSRDAYCSNCSWMALRREITSDAAAHVRETGHTVQVIETRQMVYRPAPNRPAP